MVIWPDAKPSDQKAVLTHEDSLMLAKVNEFAVVQLTTDLSKTFRK